MALAYKNKTMNSLLFLTDCLLVSCCVFNTVVTDVDVVKCCVDVDGC